MTRETWKFINTFAPWLAAIGTIGAVITSLWLAKAQNRVKLKVIVDRRITIIRGISGSKDEVVFIHIVNTGLRDINITNIWWRVGRFKRTYGYQIIPEDLYSPPLPTELKYSKEAQWCISLSENQDWIKNFVKTFLMPHWRRSISSVRLIVHTSVGKTFKARIGVDLRNHLIEECKRQSQSKKCNG